MKTKEKEESALSELAEAILQNLNKEKALTEECEQRNFRGVL